MPKKTSGTTYVHTSVGITTMHRDWLNAEALRLGTSWNDLHRRALDEYIERRERLVPRQGRPRAAPVAQTKMPLGAPS